jgi:Ser/Thr protein kinase RdoA (MazF antagonist)
LETLIKGYREFYDFNPCELNLNEALRSLRMLHYSAWLARRWEDPCSLIPSPGLILYDTGVKHILQLQLREQLAALEEESLELN